MQDFLHEVLRREELANAHVNEDLSLAGRVAIVTGGGRGFGPAGQFAVFFQLQLTNDSRAAGQPPNCVANFIGVVCFP